MPEEKLADVKGATLTADGTGVVFDVPAADVEDYIQGNLFPCLPNDEWLGTKCFFLLCCKIPENPPIMRFKSGQLNYHCVFQNPNMISVSIQLLHSKLTA